MTFTHIADASEDDNLNEDEMGEAWEEDILEGDDDDDDLWLEEQGEVA